MKRPVSAKSFWVLSLRVLVGLVVTGVATLPVDAQKGRVTNERDVYALRGPVHTVLTEYFEVNLTRPQLTASILMTFDSQGFRTEEVRFDGLGQMQSRTTYTRDGWKVFREQRISEKEAESYTLLHTFNAAGLVTGTERLDGRGASVGKQTSEFEASRANLRVHRTLDSGPDKEQAEEVIEKEDPARKLTRQTVRRNGEAASDWLIQRDAAGNVLADALSFPDGSFNKREEKPDGRTVEHRYWAPTKSHTYQVTNAQNRIEALIEESPNYYVKALYKHDASGDQIEVVNQDRSGKVLRKLMSDYVRDGFGNWTERRDRLWDAESRKTRAIEVEKRTITYY